ncbi:SDR family NAD(P)-dependent oxidoreductase [Bauldia sp.]|uniref:SDR family NAD(P)-dependent oxidoreductase n=1 Tax=Bauldia sp. TaxID=2575872 RepID=UPI003BA97D26
MAETSASPHVVITGSASGIGAAMAVHFLDQGWLVTGIDRRPPAANMTADGLRFVDADVTDAAAMEAAMRDAWNTAPVQAVIANAAITDPDHRHVVDLPPETWRNILHINVDGAFLTARAAAPFMTAQRYGNLIFVTSSLARLSDARAGDAPYCTSKAAIEMLSRVLAEELAPAGINVNTLFPSVKIDTGFFAHLSEAERAELAPPTLLNETALFLAMQPPGAVSGRSLDQQRWDTDTDYRTAWQSGRRDTL